MHDKPLGGHLGMNRTHVRMKLFTTWPRMKQKLEEYIRQCETCKKNKITQNKTKMQIKITKTPEVVWEKCDLDIVGSLSQTLEENRYVLIFQDELSKYTLAIPIEQHDVLTLSKAFVKQFTLKFGIPQIVLADQWF
jgi:transcriptional accessory protein Tex/SPT6